MTIDERLEALAARHEALAQSVELLAHTVHELSTSTDEKFQLLAAGIVQLADSQQHTEERLTRLIDVVASIAKVTQTHAERIDGLERR